MYLKVQWYVNHVGLKLWGEENVGELIINTIEELEELYTKHIITYTQYINIKKEIEQKEVEDEQRS